MTRSNTKNTEEPMNHCFSNTISTQTYLVYTLSKKHTNPNLKKLPVHYSIPVTCYCILICTAFYVPNLIGCQEFFTPRSFHSARNFFVSISIHNPTHPLPMPVSMLNVSHTILKKKSASISNIVKQGGGGEEVRQNLTTFQTKLARLLFIST